MFNYQIIHSFCRIDSGSGLGGILGWIMPAVRDDQGSGGDGDQVGAYLMTSNTSLEQGCPL